MAHNYGLLETNNGLLWHIVAKYFQALPTKVPLFRALWSLLDGIWGILKGSWGGGWFRVVIY